MRLWLRTLCSGILLIGASAGALSQADAPGEPSKLQTTNVAEYKAHLESLRELVRGCEAAATECDAKKVGDDERVEGFAGVSFQTRWSWLREALNKARNAAPNEREKILQGASARLEEDTAFAGETALPGDVDFRRARTETDKVLSEPEFQTVAEESYLQREIAKFFEWLDEIFGGVSRFGKRSPWLIPLMEWGSITLAAAGLLTWVFRTMQRQRLAVRIESSAVAGVWQKESDNWAELARAEAARQDWRAAVHCLYWATIVMMEGRKLWRQNRARTPREYVMLLEPGSRMQTALRRMTQLFERIWYGLRPAAESDYAGALALFEELRSA
jgi:hypothetical protein